MKGWNRSVHTLALKEIEMPSTIEDAMAHTFWCFERPDKLKVYYPAGNEALELLKEEIDSADDPAICVLILHQSEKTKRNRCTGLFGPTHRFRLL